MYAETLTVLTPATKTDPYTGNQVADWTKPPVATQDVDGEFQPLTSVEAVLTAQTVVTRWQAFLDATAQDGSATAVTAQSRIRFNGTDYEIDGRPDEWRVSGQVDHYELICKLVQD